jgi:small subunit ribosomal protein S17
LADEKDTEDETPATPDEVQAQTADAAEPDDAQAATPDAPEAELTQADTPAVEEPVAETAAEELAAEGPAADEAVAEEPVAETAAEAPASQPEVQLPPKERRRQARSKHEGEARPTRTAEERHADRQATRKDKAVRRRARRLQERAKAAERRAAAPAPEPLAPVHAPVEGQRRMRQGIVISDKASKTITVRIDVARRHRRYEKIVRSSSTLHAHDENDDAHEGDVVRVIESRPLSRSKRWALVDVLERAR